MKKPNMNTKTIERMKSILLVVLFLTTVLLLYFFWENVSKDPFKLSEIIYNTEDEVVPEVAETVFPTEITVGFGNEVYTVITDRRGDLWKNAVEELRKFGDNANGNLLVKEITKEKYMDAISYPSIQFQFHYDIPFDEFCTFYEMKKNQGYEIIDKVSTIAYSGMSAESILIHQQRGDKYYAIVADKDYTKFHTMITDIEANGYASYYPATTFFGSGVESKALFPLSLQSDLLEVPYEKESTQQGDDKVRDLAESFFGESFDFIRKIKDAKGNITYMYGYGQKTFNIYEDGTFEYKEEPVGSYNNTPTFFGSLDIALKFVASHGTWNSLDGTNMSAYLKKVIPIGKDKKKGYKFIFGMKIGSQNIYFQNSTPIVVDVINGQVTYYRRDMIDFSEDAATNYRSGVPQETFDPVTVLTENYDYIYEKLSDQGILLPPRAQREVAFDDIANRITAMEIGYVRPKVILEEEAQQGQESDEKMLIPCYRIVFGKDVTLYFDLFNNAEPIGVENEQTQNPGMTAESGE